MLLAHAPQPKAMHSKVLCVCVKKITLYLIILETSIKDLNKRNGELNIH